MRQQRSAACTEQLAVVRERIERWRATREKRSRMPEELWTAAVDLARAHGRRRYALHDAGAEAAGPRGVPRFVNLPQLRGRQSSGARRRRKGCNLLPSSRAQPYPARRPMGLFANWASASSRCTTCPKVRVIVGYRLIHHENQAACENRC